MRVNVTEITATVRQPEYTGENRCTPCTIVNVLLAVALAIPVTVLSPPAGALVLVGSSLAIYLRGYLVPGTPELTKRYLPAVVLRLFGKEPVPETLGDLENEALWTTLETAGLLTREGEPSLADGFRSRWLAEMDRVRDDDFDERVVERTLGVGSAAKRGDRAYSVEGNQLVRWDSRAALVADVAAAAVFRERFEDWEALDSDSRRDLFERLRLLVETCPECGGSVERDDERLDPCCQRAYTVVWAECADCGSLLAELSVPTAEDDELVPLL
jgi:hypothetical protein